MVLESLAISYFIIVVVSTILVAKIDILFASCFIAVSVELLFQQSSVWGQLPTRRLQERRVAKLDAD